MEEVKSAFANLPGCPQLLELNRKNTEQKRRSLKGTAALDSVLSELETKIKGQLLPYEELERRFKEAGCPVLPEEINLSRERFFNTFFRAQMLRDRFTVLDLAYELGILQLCVDSIRGSGRYFR